jgi:hypothetical protein
MDNPAAESSNTPIDTNEAANLLAAFFSDEPPKADQGQGSEGNAETPEAAAERLAAEELAAKQAETPEPDAPDQTGADKIPVEIDGKVVELTKSEIAEHYKNGLRQADYTRKTMEAAEVRKAAEAERSQALQERQHYSNQLNAIAQRLGAVLQEQSQINWQQLAESNPAEYIRQRHLFEQRQAAFQQAQAEQARVYQLQQAEQVESVRQYIAKQQQELLAKLPDWKDDKKAATAKQEIAKYLIETVGYAPEEVFPQQGADGRITSLGKIDHRDILLAHKAMLYDQLMSKAQAATKKVEKLPPKMERPGNGEAGKVDGRSAAMQRLSKSGSVEDAAAVFAQIL